MVNSYLFEDENRRRQREAEIFKNLAPKIIATLARFTRGATVGRLVPQKEFPPAPLGVSITGGPVFGPEGGVPLATKRAAEAQGVPAWGGLPLLAQQATTPLLPHPAREAIADIPIVGPIAEPMVSGLTSPIGLAATAVWPALTARMVGYGIGGALAGKGLETAGVPIADVGPLRVGPSGVGETAGMLAGPFAGPTLERAAMRGAAQLPTAARAGAQRVSPSMRRLFAEELGGPKMRPKYVLTNDIHSLAEINKRLGQLSKIPKLTAKQRREWDRLLAEKDLHDLRATGSVDDQMDNLLDDILEMEKELELRAVRQEYKPLRAPQFGTAERAEWEAARAGGPHGVRPSTRYSSEPIEHLRERVKVYREFRDEMKIMPAGEEAAEEALVTRAKFTERGEVVEEPTFATEGELAGVRPVQAELGIGAGERPIETAGPMFEKPAAPEVPARAAMEEAATISSRQTIQNIKLAKDIGATAGKPPKPPKPPKPGEPPTGPTEPQGEAMLDYMLGKPPHEKADRALIRRYEGQVHLERIQDTQRLRETVQRARASGVNLTNKRTPEMEQLWWAVDVQAPPETAIRQLPENMQETARALRLLQDMETQRMIRDIPDFNPREFYFHHGWLREGKAPRRGLRPGERPGFVKQRKYEGTIFEAMEQREREIAEAIAAGKKPPKPFEPITWNPVEMLERRLYQGVLYRQQFVLLDNAKRIGLAQRRTALMEQLGSTEGWRVPKGIKAFESRPVPGKPDVYTEPWFMADDAAGRFEDYFNLSYFSGKVPLRTLREAVATLKFVKTFGGLFQYFDYSNRIIASAMQYKDIAMLGGIPRAFARGFWPGLDAKMTALEMQDDVVKALIKHGLAREAGMEFVAAELPVMMEQMKLFHLPIVGKALKNLGTATYRNAHKEFVTHTARRIAVNRMKNGGMTLDEAAAQTALDVNERFSSLPSWQSVFRDPTIRDLARSSVFSIMESECWVRMPFTQKVFLLTILLTAAAQGNIVSLITKGEPLPRSAYKPFDNVPLVDYDPLEEGPKMLGYNTRFLRAELPYKGADGRLQYLDTLGQGDTTFRFMASPKFAVQARLGQIPGAAIQVATGKTWFGQKELRSPKDIGLFLAEQVSPIPAAGFWDERRRIGTTGALIQATGWNVSSERLGELFARRYKEETGRDWDETTVIQRREDVAAHPELQEIKAERLEAGLEYGSAFSERTAYMNNLKEQQKEAIQESLRTDPTGAKAAELIKESKAQRAQTWQVLSDSLGLDGQAPKESEVLPDFYADKYMAVEREMDVFGQSTDEQWERYDIAQQQVLVEAKAAGVDEAYIKKRATTFWDDPQLDLLETYYQQAKESMREYQDIPRFVGVPDDLAKRAEAILQAAQAMAATQGVPLNYAIAVVGKDDPQAAMIAAMESRLQNPMRSLFWKQHPELSVFWGRGAPAYLDMETVGV